MVVINGQATICRAICVWAWRSKKPIYGDMTMSLLLQLCDKHPDQRRRY